MTTKSPMRFTKVNAVYLHHKAVHVAAFVTRTQTVPQLFLRIYHQTRFVVIMERTETYELLPALRDGRISRALLDDKVQRLLGLAERFGWLDDTKVDASISRYNRAGKEVARQGALEGMVLLKNERARLPLAKNARVALFGNGSYDTLRGGTGSGNVNAAHSVSLAAGLSAAGYAVDAPLQQQYQEHIARANASSAPREGIAAFLPVELAPDPALDAAALARSVRESDAAVITASQAALALRSVLRHSSPAPISCRSMNTSPRSQPLAASQP